MAGSVSPGIDPGYSRLPQSKIIIMYNVYLVYCSCVEMYKFLAVHRVGLMTHGKCRVDCPFLYLVIRFWVRTSAPPPPCSMGIGSTI
jgi:hypothetical protein